MKKIPNKTKYSRPHKIKNILGVKGKHLGGSYSVALRIKSAVYLTYTHLETARRAISRLVKPKEMKNKKNTKHIHSAKKKFKHNLKRKRTKKRKFLLIRSNISLPLTRKPLQVRMGKGKGAVNGYAFAASSSRSIMEMSRQRLRLRRIVFLLKKAARKLPVKTKITYDRFSLRRETNLKTT